MPVITPSLVVVVVVAAVADASRIAALASETAEGKPKNRGKSECIQAETKTNANKNRLDFIGLPSFSLPRLMATARQLQWHGACARHGRRRRNRRKWRWRGSRRRCTCRCAPGA